MKGTAKKLSTGIYVRVSTEEQAQEGYSVRGQTDKLKSYALIKEWDIYDIYADEGISGKNIIDRPAINRLMADVECGKVNNVLVFKVDRLTRNTKNLLELVELFNTHNCSFNSLTESIDTQTASGRMFLKIIGIFAEFERENIIERIKVGCERKVREGYTLACICISYGYDRPNGQKIPTINPCESEIVKEMFSMYVNQNYSMNKIARELNERKIPTKKGARMWASSTIRSMLMNPTYIGKVRYATKDEHRYFEANGLHEPIISDELFQFAQERLKNIPHISRTKHPKEQSYFCGVMVCGRCGAKITTHNYKSGKNAETYTTAYKCRAMSSSEIEKCESYCVTHSKVEHAFLDYIDNISDITESVDIEPVDNGGEKLLKIIVAFEKKLQSMQNRKNHVMEQYMDGILEFDEYKRMISYFNEKSDALENEIQQKKTELSETATTPELLPEDIITNIHQSWEHLTDTEKMIFLRRFVKKITISVEKESYNSSVAYIDSVEFKII
ncbi:MAG: recombinase family protein [Oscillospiraceae bacterium]|jgi:site-specific DNA recombinase|nr:recombinase family protein [Oscillospiraceae bacterium]